MKAPQQSGRDLVLRQFSAIENYNKHAALQQMVILLRKKHPHPEADILGRRQIGISLGIFSQDTLSCLESIVKYLKETKGMKLGSIAKLLNRDNRTIWSTYSNATKKMPEPLSAEGKEMPALLIADRALSVLEHVVSYAKSLGMKNHEVALLLHLDDRTIWSAYDKAKRKGGG